MNSADLVVADASFYPTIEALAKEVESLLVVSDIDAALERIQGFVRAVMFDRRSVAKVFADAVLDSLCQRMGAAVAPSLALPERAQIEDRVDCVILATELYRAGGHSAVIGDLVRTGRFGPRTVLMLTDTLNSADPTIADERYGDLVEVEMAPAGVLLEKLHWTLSRLLVLRPRRLILFNHHYDSVAIAAAQPGIADEIVFYHHGDHQLCLGATLTHTLHVDPHPMGFYHCRGELGLTANVYWPLDVDDLGTRARTNRDSALRTCSSGSSNKFELDYKYRYADIVPQLIARTGGTHVHIGPLSESALQRIYGGLVDLAVPQGRFIHIPWVSSVWRTLQQQQIDLYLTSFPLGGGRVAIEAMGAGIPIVGHDSFLSPFYGGQDMLYPEAFLWKTPSQLLSHLEDIDFRQLERESRLARTHYERYHTKAALIRAIDAGSAAPAPPPLRPQRSDPMQSFLDDVHYALRDHLTAAEIAPLLAQLEQDRVARAVRDAEVAAFEENQINKTTALIKMYAQEIVQLRGEVAQARAREERVSSRIKMIERSRSWRLARLMQRAVTLLRN
ncbi:glycosyltransferase family 4 protein [Paraburkholderia caribensis]|uniref:glycosyltransferase family 4 protein n=1 Tax=Paraburkholderia caribensis TaxID=75105 RepID=UPI00078C06E0|nr:glycosyltransferase family 4 protein [Paraburkholderia caribensis]AMV43457.1 hypothetical protein ATN79_12300 [Paraburkholderia caribensis]